MKHHKQLIPPDKLERLLKHESYERASRDHVGRWPFNIPEKMPLALGLRGIEKPGQKTWEDWEEDMLRRYPVRFRLGHYWPRELRSFFRRKLVNPLRAFVWFLKYHTTHRYHLLDLRSPVNGYRWGWLETNDEILFASFAALVSFVEVQKGFEGHIDWDADNEQKNVRSEALALYGWWTKERSEERKDTKPIIEEEQLNKKDDDQLRKLIAIRHHLWT